MIPVIGFPMGRAVLMPGNRGAEAGFLDEGHFVVGNEVFTENRLRNGQETGMAV